MFLKYAAANVRAQTEKGDKLIPENLDAEYELPLSEGGRHFQVTLDFQAPRNVGLGKVQLRGKFQMEMAAGTERIRFENLRKATGVARAVAGSRSPCNGSRSRNPPS